MTGAKTVHLPGLCLRGAGSCSQGLAQEFAGQAFQTVQEGSREKPYLPPDIKSLYCVPANMTQLFLESGHKKRSTLEGSEVRRIITDYAKRNNLVDADNRNLVKLDPILCDCILEKNEQHVVMKLPWDSLLTGCLKNLQPAYQVTFPGQEPIIKKGKLCPIDITLVLKTYKKKVTVVRNSETYGPAQWPPFSSSDVRPAPSSLLPLGPKTVCRCRSRETRSTTSASYCLKSIGSLENTSKA